MAERQTARQRIEMHNVAEREVMRYADNHAMWHKHVHNVELDPIQVLKSIEMDEHPNTLDYSSRRTGKTAEKELYNLKENATKPDQELGIIAPREAQAIVNLEYHLDAVSRSEILTAHLMFKNGRRQKSDTYYQFNNRSKGRAYGIMSNADGGGLTSASLEEVDDMPKERLFSRYLLMLGSTRRMGADESSSNDPQIRITGVFKGADTLTDLLNSAEYHSIGCFHGDRAKQEIQRFIDLGYMDKDAVDLDSYLFPVPIANALNGMDLGILNRPYIESMRRQLSEDEFTRQLLCVNTASRNLIWEKYIRRAMQVGLEAPILLASPMPGETYKKRGLISFGFDAAGHGENPKASRNALVVTEQLGNHLTFPFVKTWPPGEDDNVVRRDLLGLWKYFNPDTAMGDAYAVGMLTSLNDDLFAEQLTPIDRRTIGDGQSTASTWPEWPFAPIRFQGMVKHSMAQALRAAFHKKQAAIPYFDDQDMADPDLIDMRLFVKQLANIIPVATLASYASYKMASTDLGDDLFDAAMASVWGLVTRGAASLPTTVLIRRKTREQLLGAT